MYTPTSVSNYPEYHGVDTDYYKNGIKAQANQLQKINQLCNYTRFLEKIVFQGFYNETINNTNAVSLSYPTTPRSGFQGITIPVNLPNDLSEAGLKIRVRLSDSTTDDYVINNFQLAFGSSAADSKKWVTPLQSLTSDNTLYFYVPVYPQYQLGTSIKDDFTAEQWLNIYYDSVTLNSGNYPTLKSITIIDRGHDELDVDYDNETDLLCPKVSTNQNILDYDLYTLTKNTQEKILRSENRRNIWYYSEEIITSDAGNFFSSPIFLPIDKRTLDGEIFPLYFSVWVTGSETIEISWRRIDGTWISLGNESTASSGWFSIEHDIDISTAVENNEDFIEIKIEKVSISHRAFSGFSIHCNNHTNFDQVK